MGAQEQDEAVSQHPAVTISSYSVTRRSEAAGNRAAVFRAGTTMLTMISPRRDAVG